MPAIKAKKPISGAKAAEPRGGHLGGDGDGREREAGDEIEANGAEPNALKRTEQRPLFFFVVVHRSAASPLNPTDARFTLPLRGRVERASAGSGWGERPKSQAVAPPHPDRFARSTLPLKGRVSPLVHYPRFARFALDVIRSWRSRRS